MTSVVRGPLEGSEKVGRPVLPALTRNSVPPNNSSTGDSNAAKGALDKAHTALVFNNNYVPGVPNKPRKSIEKRPNPRKLKDALSSTVNPKLLSYARTYRDPSPVPPPPEHQHQPQPPQPAGGIAARDPASAVLKREAVLPDMKEAPQLPPATSLPRIRPEGDQGDRLFALYTRKKEPAAHEPPSTRYGLGKSLPSLLPKSPSKRRRLLMSTAKKLKIAYRGSKGGSRASSRGSVRGKSREARSREGSPSKRSSRSRGKSFTPLPPVSPPRRGTIRKLSPSKAKGVTFGDMVPAPPPGGRAEGGAPGRPPVAPPAGAKELSPAQVQRPMEEDRDSHGFTAPHDMTAREHQQNRHPTADMGVRNGVFTSKTDRAREKTHVYSGAVNRFFLPVDMEGEIEEQDPKKPLKQYNYFDATVRWDQEDPALDPDTYSVDSGFVRMYWSRRTKGEVEEKVAKEAWWHEYKAGHPVDLTIVSKFVYKLQPRSILDFKPMFTLAQDLLIGLLDEKLVHILDDRARFQAECDARLAAMQADLDRQLADMLARLQALEAALKAAHEERDRLRAAMEEQRRSNEGQLEAEKARMQAEHEAAMAAATATIGELQQSLAASQARVADLEALQAQMQARLDDLVAEGRAKDFKIAALEKKNKELAKRNAELEAAVAAKDARIAELEDQARRDADELARLLAELAALRAEMERLRSEGVDADLLARLAALEAELAAARQQLAAAEARAEAAEKRAAQAEADLAASQADMASLRSQLQAANAALAQAKAESEALRQSIAALQEQAAKDRAALEALGGQPSAPLPPPPPPPAAAVPPPAAPPPAAPPSGADADLLAQLEALRRQLAAAEAEAAGARGRAMELLFGEGGAWTLVHSMEGLQGLGQLAADYMRRAFAVDGELTHVIFPNATKGKDAAAGEAGGKEEEEDIPKTYDDGVQEVLATHLRGHSVNAALERSECPHLYTALNTNANVRGVLPGASTQGRVVAPICKLGGAGRPWGCVEFRGPSDSLRRAEAAPAPPPAASPADVAAHGDPVRGMDCVSMYAYGMARALQTVERNEADKLGGIIGLVDQVSGNKDKAAYEEEAYGQREHEVQEQKSKRRTINKRLTMLKLRAVRSFTDPVFERALELQSVKNALNLARRKLEKMMQRPSTRKDLAEIARYRKGSFSVTVIMASLLLMLDETAVFDACTAYNEAHKCKALPSAAQSLLHSWNIVRSRMNLDVMFEKMAEWDPVPATPVPDPETGADMRPEFLKTCTWALATVGVKEATRGSKASVAVREWVDVCNQLRTISLEEEQMRKEMEEKRHKEKSAEMLKRALKKSVDPITE